MKKFKTTINFEQENLKEIVANLYDTMVDVYDGKTIDNTDLHKVLSDCWVFLDEIYCVTFDEDY